MIGRRIGTCDHQALSQHPPVKEARQGGMVGRRALFDEAHQCGLTRGGIRIARTQQRLDVLAILFPPPIAIAQLVPQIVRDLGKDITLPAL